MNLLEEFKSFLFTTKQNHPPQIYNQLKRKRYYHAKYTDFSTTVHTINIEKILKANNNTNSKVL